MLYQYFPSSTFLSKLSLLSLFAFVLSFGLFAQENSEKFSDYPFQQESTGGFSSSSPFASKPFQGELDDIDFIDQAGPPVDNGLPIEDYAWILIPLAGALVIQFRKKLL